MTDGSKRSLELCVSAEYDGQKASKVLRERLQLSGTLLKRLKYEGGILLNGAPIRTVDRVKAGDMLKITMREREGSPHVIPVQSDFEIVFEDADLIVVNKPAYMSVHSSRKSDLHSLANALAYYFQQKGEYHIFRAVNRLDRQTSGLMIVAKNEYANTQLIRQLKEKRVEKTYLAVTDGIPPAPAGTLRFPIKRADDSVLKRVVAPDGKEAVTHYRVRKQIGNLALVEIRLETGRTHQIRVHFSHIGCPLLGDWLYGTEEGAPIGRQALHSWKLAFLHPLTGEKLTFEAGLPQDISQLFQV